MRMYNSIFWSILKTFFDRKQEQEYSPISKRITFENKGRSGMAIYQDGNKSIRFYTEAGGGDCIFYMVIPSAEEWESQSGYPLVERHNILEWIAEESLRKQTNPARSYYKIGERHITFYQK